MTRVSSEFKEFQVPLYIDEDGLVRDSKYERDTRLQRNIIYGNTYLVILYTVRTYSSAGSVYGGRDNLGFPPESEQDLFLYDCFIKNEFEEIVFDDMKKAELFNLYRNDLYYENIN